MDREVSLVDLGFQNFQQQEKREMFMILDIVMKEYHKNNYMITSFDPKDIYYQNGIFSYSKFSNISPLNSTDKSDAILNNIIGLSNLAFCSYLPDYDLSRGLLNIEALNKNYDKFEGNFVPMDRGYYRSVLIDGVNNKKLPDTVYYYDYIAEKMKDTNLSDRNNSNVRSFVKATEAGKLLTEKNDEAAFGRTFFFASMVASMLIAFIGLALCFIK